MTLDQLNDQLEHAERALTDPTALLTTAERKVLEAQVEHGNSLFVSAVAAEGGLALLTKIIAAEIARDAPNHVPAEWTR